MPRKATAGPAFLFAALAAALPARAAPEDAIGLWRTADRQAAIEITPCDPSLCGRLIWYVETRTGPDAGLDSNNPDERQRGRPLCGIPMLGGFQREGEGWADGWVYDPKSGDTYSGTITPEGRDRLRLHGYIGIPLFGRTEIWSRAPADQQRCRLPE